MANDPALTVLTGPCAALSATGGLLRDGHGRAMNPAELLQLCKAESLDMGQLKLIAMAIMNVAEARRYAESVGQLESYNLLGVQIIPEDKAFRSIPIMRNHEP